jgi:Chlororespiratory reduction 6
MKPMEPVVVVVSRSEVERGDITIVMEPLAALFAKPEIARANRVRLDVAFAGYDDDSRELFEIDEVREFVRRLDERFPYWMYFNSRYGTSLNCILLCFMPPFLTDEAKKKYFPDQLVALIEKRWLPATEKMCSYAGLTENDIEDLLNSFVDYSTRGPQQYS